jgi:acetylglutamate kinase
VDNSRELPNFLEAFSRIKGRKLLIHGGGKKASELSARLGLPVRMHEGRRITDQETLEVAVMVYAGLINKQIVAYLQANHCQSIGICGADAGCVSATRRPIQTIDYGFVGDIHPEQISKSFFINLLEQDLVPVFAPITHDGTGQLLNTNADSVAAALAVALSSAYKVHLLYCFEKKGVMRNVSDENSLIPEITPDSYAQLREQGYIRDGMIPKMDNAFAAIQAGVFDVVIGSAAQLSDIVAGKHGSATRCHPGKDAFK